MKTLDAFVGEAAAHSQGEHVRVLSLDVFDTLLWRTVPEPADAFALVGDALAHAGRLDVRPEAFARVRSRAEERARARGTAERGSSEVSLEEIYAELPASLVGGLTSAELAAVELGVERSITFPDLAVVELVQSLRAARDLRVVLVSNTYFSAAQLRHLVDRPPLADLRFDAVFVSSEARRHKGSGLYDVVLQTLGVHGHEVVHLGDDPDADVRCPGARGIRSAILPRRPEPLQTVLEREGAVRAEGAARRRTPLEGRRTDFGLTALRAKTLRRSDGPADGEERVCWTTGATVLGPVLTGFAEWVHRRAAAAGADRVFCLMREGAFLAPLISSSPTADGVDAATLWVSRYVCTQAAVVTASAEELETFLRRRSAPPLGTACVDLGLAPERLPDLADRLDVGLDDPDLRRRFVRQVSGDPDLRATVVAHCAAARRRLVKHVIASVGTDSGEIVIVDIGWGASIQAALDRALRAEGSALRTRGLYLMTNDAATDRLLDGVVAEGFLGDLGLPDPAVRWVVRSPEVLEQLCMPAVGSLRGFDDDGRPLTGPVRDDPAQQAQRDATRRGVLAFQQEWTRYRDVVPADEHALDDAARGLLLRMLLRFVVEPTTEEARVFGAWSHDENAGSESAQDLLDGMPGRRLQYLSPTALLETPMTRLYWPFALAALHNPPLARAASAVAFDELPEDVFTSGHDDVVTLYVDYGVGLLPRRRTTVRANSAGLYYLRQDLDAHPLRAVAVGFPPGPGLVRLDWLRLRFGVRGRADEVVDVEWPHADARVGYAGGVLLAGNLLHGRRTRPKLSFRCPEDWGAEVYRVEVELGFAWLPAAPDVPPPRDLAGTALALARRARPRVRQTVDLVRAVRRRIR